jgi:hypothetical protein
MWQMAWSTVKQCFVCDGLPAQIMDKEPFLNQLLNLILVIHP